MIFRRALAAARTPLTPPAPATPVDIVLAYAGCDGRLVDAAGAEGRGLVVGAMGRGNVPPPMSEALERWIATGRPVVVASRALRGRVGHTYGYPGGGRRLFEMGALFAGSRRPQQARIDLMLALGLGLAGDALRDVFDT